LLPSFVPPEIPSINIAKASSPYSCFRLS